MCEKHGNDVLRVVGGENGWNGAKISAGKQDYDSIRATQQELVTKQEVMTVKCSMCTQIKNKILQSVKISQTNLIEPDL